MYILHIAAVHDNPFSGVVRAVPQYVMSQQNISTVAYINIYNRKHDEIINQIEYRNNIKINDLKINGIKPDLVVFHEIYHIEFIKVAKLLKKHKIPYVIIPHGGLTEKAQKQKKLKKIMANILIFNKFINRAKSIQFLSNEEMTRSNFKNNYFIEPNGVSIPEINKEYRISDRIRFTYIGRLEVDIKGLDIMLAAINECKDLMRYNIGELNLYGPALNENLSMLSTLIEQYDLSDLVRVNPPVSGKEKEMVLLETDIYIQTSRSEGMPQGILEAMSYGIPCIVTKGTNLGDVINNNNAGWVADTNEKDIAYVITQALNERDKWGLYGTNGREASKRFSWESIAKDTVNQYKSFLN